MWCPLGNRNKKVFLNKFSSFLFFYDQRKPKGKPKSGLINLCCLLIVLDCIRPIRPIKDQWSIAIIIRAIKSQSRFLDKPEKPQDFYDPFVMHFHFNETNYAREPSPAISFLTNNGFRFQISEHFLKPTTERTVKFQILFKLYLKFKREVNRIRIMHHLARLFMT